MPLGTHGARPTSPGVGHTILASAASQEKTRRPSQQTQRRQGQCLRQWPQRQVPSRKGNHVNRRCFAQFQVPDQNSTFQKLLALFQDVAVGGSRRLRGSAMTGACAPWAVTHVSGRIPSVGRGLYIGAGRQHNVRKRSIPRPRAVPPSNPWPPPSSRAHGVTVSSQQRHLLNLLPGLLPVKNMLRCC
eukprot:349620-Chlamydomonas_euryale.AAC.2